MNYTEPGGALLQLLQDWGFADGSSMKPASQWSSDQLKEFLEAAQHAIETCTQGTLEILARSKSPLVLYPEEHSQRSTSLLRRCLLYADWTILPISLPKADVVSERNRAEIAEKTHKLNEFVPFLQTGLFLPVRAQLCVPTLRFDGDPFLREFVELQPVKEIIRRHAVTHLVEENVRAVDRSGNASTTQVRRIYAEFDKAIVANITGSIPAATTVELPLNPVHITALKRLDADAASTSGADVRETLLAAVGSRIREILHDWQLATGLYRSALVTESEITWDVLNQAEIATRGTQAMPTQRSLMDLELPFLDHLPIHLIAAERHRLLDQLHAFRSSLDDLAREASQVLSSPDRDREMRRLHNKHVYEPLRELRLKMHEISRQRLTELAGSCVVVASTAAVAIYAGQSVPAALCAGLVGAAGGVKLIDSVAKLLQERASLARSPVYLLWRIQQQPCAGRK